MLSCMLNQGTSQKISKILYFNTWPIVPHLQVYVILTIISAHLLGRAAPYIPIIPNMSNATPTAIMTWTMTNTVLSSSADFTYWLIKKSNNTHRQNPTMPPPNN